LSWDYCARAILFGIALILIIPASSLAEQPDAEAAAAYHQGRAGEAIAKLEHVFAALEYGADKSMFLRIAQLLLELYWRVEDAAGIESVVNRERQLLAPYKNLEAPDFQLLVTGEAWSLRAALLRGDLVTVREQGTKFLATLQLPQWIGYKAARRDLLVTLAMSHRAEFRLREAESYMHQAIGIAVQDDQLYGFGALDFLHALLRHYMESGQYQYASLIARRLQKAKTAFAQFSDTSIDGFSLALLMTHLTLQTPGGAFDPSVVQMLQILETMQTRIERLPQRLRIVLYATLLYISVVRNEAEKATRAASALEAFYVDRGKTERSVANVLAWGLRRLARRAEAEEYVRIGSASPNEVNVYLFPLNMIVSSLLDFDAGQRHQAAQKAVASFAALLRNVASRTFAEPAATIGLSFDERTVFENFVDLASDLISMNERNPDMEEALAIASQLLQRDRIPRGALLAPGLVASTTAGLEEHLRARELLAQNRYRAVLDAVGLLADRAATGSMNPDLKSYEYLEAMRLIEYQFRLNQLDAYLQPSIYAQTDFVASRLAVALPRDIRRVLEPDEALVSHLAVRSNRLLIECVTREGTSFYITPLDVKALIEQVRLVNLAVSATHPASIQLDSLYPAGDALAIYRTLFEPASACLSGKKRIVLATDPYLLGVPFNALLTEMPRLSSDGYNLREAPWMIKRWALSIALSRSTLFYQRSRPPIGRPQKAFIGFGNPAFAGAPNSRRFIDPRDIYASRGAERLAAIRALPQLPETQSELYAMSSYLGPTDSVVFLGADATERNVRGQNLEDYRVVAFATHGLTAGEFDSLTEPALVLTPGDTGDTRNDGLLAMSEIARLKVGADVVLLSACNTAAGDGTPSSLGFGGLVNSFLFAGARAVLASQWPVESKMAERLTTGMFAAQASDQAMPLSVALQRSMLKIVSDSGNAAFAHPRFWAPFLLVGDGPRPAQTAGLVTSTKPALSTRWERNLGEQLSGEVLRVASSKDGAMYAVAISEATGQRSSSVILALSHTGEERWRVKDNVVAAGANIVEYGAGRIAVDGSIWSNDRLAGAVLRSFSATGQELWRVVVDTPEFDQSIALLPLPGKQLLWVVSTAPNSGGVVNSVLTMMLIDEGGSVTSSRTETLSGDGFGFLSSIAATRWRGQLLIAVGTMVSVSDTKEVFGDSSRDVLSGYSTACAIKRLTHLIQIDEASTRVTSHRTIEGMNIRRFKKSPGEHLLAAGTIWPRCLEASDAGVLEIDENLGVRILFQYGGPLEKWAGDVTILPDGRLVLAGQMTTVFDLEAYRKIDLTDTKRFVRPFDGEFLDSDRKTFSAFFVLLDSGGSFITDRVISDLRGRWINALTTRPDGSVLAGGKANGTSSWLTVIDVR
jgi:CHAT domain-containing protein